MSSASATLENRPEIGRRPEQSGGGAARSSGRSAAPDARTYALGFALEYSLGHITHSENLKQRLAGDGSVRPTYVDLPYQDTPGAWARLPGVRSNWSLRASIGAYLGLRGAACHLDAALFHTQVTSLLSTGFMRRVPSVVSLDATPLQYDALGAAYGHAPSGSAKVEAFKKRMNERAFRAARHLITWSQWAKDSLVADYGVAPEKVTVIPPGIHLHQWDFAAERPRPSGAADGTINLLFVGGDFPRKGGDTLAKALDLLPEPARSRVHLHAVTKTEDLGPEADAAVAAGRMTVHRGVTPNSDRLRALFARADAFVFPTRADCLPLAVLEALAAGLPVITTSVAALPEAVRHGENGVIVPPDAPDALAEAVAQIAADGALRQRLSACSRATAEERFDARANYRRIIEILKGVAR
jgi:Glycosyltransferase